MTNPEEPREPTGLEWASLDDICEELHRRYRSFVLTAISEHKTDHELYTRVVRYADSITAYGLCALAAESIRIDCTMGGHHA